MPAKELIFSKVADLQPVALPKSKLLNSCFFGDYVKTLKTLNNFFATNLGGCFRYCIRTTDNINAVLNKHF